MFVYTYGNLDIDGEYNNIFDLPSNYAVYIGSNCPNIYARQNYWGSSQPVATDIFSDPSKITNWSDSLSSPMPIYYGKAANMETSSIIDLFSKGKEDERAGNYSNAMKKYDEIISNSTDADVRVKTLRYRYGIVEKVGSDFDEMCSKISHEIPNADSSNKVILRYLLNDILLKEKKYGNAVNNFIELGNTYKCSSVEVDALVKVAMIYGLYIGDKLQAEKYANIACALNPGHLTLLDAFAAADINYEPWKHENKYAELSEDLTAFDAIQSVAKTGDNRGEYVSISPNPATTITYSIKNPSNVRLSIYSINGQKVATLVNGSMNAGKHSVTFNGSKYASGVYFYRFESAGLTKSGKLLLLK